MNNVIPIFYACDDNFVKFAIVSITSLIENADKSRKYHIHILITDISKENCDVLENMQTENVQITFHDVTEYDSALHGKLPIRDYYTKTTYFRLYIAKMFPEYDKAIYIDSDTVVLGDISELYDHDLNGCYVGAAHEQVMKQVDEYGTYVEKVVGINRHAFFNAGVLVINCDLFRKKDLLGRFMSLLQTYNFVVTQDEDYLNVLCKDHVHWVGQEWNSEVFGELVCKEEDIKIIHYIMVSKPWHYDDCRLKEYFWKYAVKTPFYEHMKNMVSSYTDEQKANDLASCDRLLQLAITETNRPDRYLCRVRQGQSADRIKVLNKIEQLENDGIFDIDVEEDPPSRTLYSDEINYTEKTKVGKAKRKVAYALANSFVKYLKARNRFIVKDIVGAENFSALDSGAIITCNHFNAFDSFAIQLAYYASGQKKRKFYRVIREGNYTSFPGFYGFLMRNCDTLPLSSDRRTMVNFVKGVNKLLSDGHFILFYPEQSMWWNYRKPKPLKDGAFNFAAKNKVPVLPCFITMNDSDYLDKDGFYVQEYTVHVGNPIYPDENLTVRENAAMMREKNYEQWKTVYESVYDMPLIYNIKDKEIS